MSKLVIVKLVSIRYSGRSVGDSFTIEVEAPGASLSFNRKLGFGKVTVTNKEIGRFITDQSVINATVRLVERDPVFNDFGAAQINLNVNRSNSSVCAVEVTETGAVPGKAAALFHLTFETKSLDTTRYSYLALEYPSRPWSKGFYDVEIPDYPHGGGNTYSRARHAVTWFRVGHEGDRYIHVGLGTAGCITLTELGRWDELYSILIAARKGDGVSVGTLQVVD